MTELMPLDFDTAAALNFVKGIIEKHGRQSDKVIPLLLELQKKYNYLPEPALRELSHLTAITPASISGIATFYSQFRMTPAGRHFLDVCTGTACHVKGSDRLIQTLNSQLHLAPGEDTDRKMNFTIRKVACLGCCTLAPVIQIDGRTFGHVSAHDVQDILDLYKNADRPEKAAARVPDLDTRSKKNGGEIRIGVGSCCVAGGSQDVREKLEETLSQTGYSTVVKPVGCVGMCHRTPLVELRHPDGSRHHYANVTTRMAQEIVERHFQSANVMDRLRRKSVALYNLFLPDVPEDPLLEYEIKPDQGAVSNFLAPQVHIATEYSGILDPLDFDEYRQLGGFSAFENILENSTADQVVQEVTDSGLRGRGGGGFPTGKKFAIVRAAAGEEKFLICNGDEGDPGAFMDRMLLESYPYRLIEGMLIAAYAVGTARGFLYIRAEYPLAVKRIQSAIERCYEKGCLGENILDSQFSFNLEIREGAGAFVCGEETALIKSIEGQRGAPDIRPPYPAQEGLWNKPTLVNNAETFSVIPWIFRNGAQAFRAYGTEKSSGTKVFALAGKVKHGGLIEVPMGITINEIVNKIGGGVNPGREFKAVQIGGPSGGCIPASMGDLKIDYEALIDAGAMMGSGGLLVMDDRDCMVDIARYFLSFTQDQSCGKCTYCRVGTKRMLELLEKICAGKGSVKDLDLLEELSRDVQSGSICGLGKTAPNPVLTTLKYFRSEYEEHLNGFCRAGKCTDLIRYFINEKCTGCTVCAQQCPVNAIPYEPYKVHTIDQDLCIKCDTCLQVCEDDAVKVLSGD